MSELTPCNFCTFEGIKVRAKQNGRRVVVKKKPLKDFDKAVDIHVVKRGEAVSTKNWVVWFAELTNCCVC